MENLVSCNSLVNKLADFGLGAVVIGCLLLFIWQMLKFHAEERKGWRESVDKINGAIQALSAELGKMNERGRKYDTKEG